MQDRDKRVFHNLIWSQLKNVIQTRKKLFMASKQVAKSRYFGTLSRVRIKNTE